jgi:hypothetical protein
MLHISPGVVDETIELNYKMTSEMLYSHYFVKTSEIESLNVGVDPLPNLLFKASGNPLKNDKN